MRRPGLRSTSSDQRNGSVSPCPSMRARARTCPADHPVCRRPARQGAGRAKPVKMQRPAGRTILTGLAWSAGLVPWSMADGMIRLHPSASYARWAVR